MWHKRRSRASAARAPCRAQTRRRAPARRTAATGPGGVVEEEQRRRVRRMPGAARDAREFDGGERGEANHHRERRERRIAEKADLPRAGERQDEDGGAHRHQKVAAPPPRRGGERGGAGVGADEEREERGREVAEHDEVREVGAGVLDHDRDRHRQLALVAEGGEAERLVRPLLDGGGRRDEQLEREVDDAHDAEHEDGEERDAVVREHGRQREDAGAHYGIHYIEHAEDERRLPALQEGGSSRRRRVVEEERRVGGGRGEHGRVLVPTAAQLLLPCCRVRVRNRRRRCS